MKLRRFLGISANAAMRIKHKLQMVMKHADDGRPLRGFVQIDDVYWGGKQSDGKTPFVAALQRNVKGHPIFIRFSCVGSFSSDEMMKWGQKHLAPQSPVVSDGLAYFKSFKHIGHFHYSVRTTGRYGSSDFTFFDWLNTVIGNVKNAITGTYHGMDHRHLPRYLGEFCFRFNRRFDLLRSVVNSGNHQDTVSIWLNGSIISQLTVNNR